jgi:iron complex transport system substrate-binding protein
MAVFALVLAASARIASLNLCSDEYLLLLARPGEVASVSRLAQDPAETSLASLAQRVPGNRGRIEDIIALHPDVVLTMGGGGGRSSGAIARALGMQVVDLPQPGSLDGIAANLRAVAGALGDSHRADALIARLARLRASLPRTGIDSIYLGHGGISQSPGSLGAQWMRTAGLVQRPLSGGKASLEMLATNLPKLLLISDYRSGQMSQGQRWLTHPIVARTPSRKVTTDGRPWTCAGPLMIPEIERLRRVTK